MSKKRADMFSGEIGQGLGIIQGWKAIGKHIGRSGRTARRWYDKGCLIVYHSHTGRPFAFIFVLDRFMGELDKALKKHGSETMKRLQQQAAMMRERKRAKNGKATDESGEDGVCTTGGNNSNGADH